MKIRNLTAVAVMAVIICICSWISIPMVVPFTMQTFGVFMAMFLLGGKTGTAAVALYILMGAAGLPVFAGFRGGIGHLMGPTGGYIIGFLTLGLIYWTGESGLIYRTGESGLIYRTGEKRTDGSGQSVRKYILQILGLISCYVFGTLWYVIVAGGGKSFWAAVAICVAPYILPDLVKLYLAGFVTNRIKKHLISG